MQFIYVPFSWLMKGCLFLSNNSYVFALFFFALAIALLLLPLTIKQQKSQILMAKVKPKEMAIREKYKGRNDQATQQKMMTEIQTMYQENGYNQFSGCLPLLIQLPIVLILFNIVQAPISYGSKVDTSNFDLVNSADRAVVYYNTLKENLNPDAYEEYKDYQKDLEAIDKHQSNVVSNVKLEGEGDLILATTEDESKAGNYAEMGIVRLATLGYEEMVKYEEEGKLKDAEAVKAAYNALGYDDLLGVIDENGKRDKIADFNIGPISLLNTPNFTNNLILIIVPVLVFLTSFLSTKLTRKVSGSAQQTDANGNPVGGGLFMEVGMPLMSAVFAFMMPAAIGVYWIWRTLISMVQSVIMAKAMPIPKVTEEDIAAARKEMKEKQRNKKKKVITIEVDEDDNSYDDMMVNKDETGKKTVTIDPTTRKPRHVEMLTADDEEETKPENTDKE